MIAGITTLARVIGVIVGMISAVVLALSYVPTKEERPPTEPPKFLNMPDGTIVPNPLHEVWQKSYAKWLERQSAPEGWTDKLKKALTDAFDKIGGFKILWILLVLLVFWFLYNARKK